MRCKLLLVLLPALLAGCASTRESASLTEGARAELALLETTDLHANVLSYDYYRLAADPSLGFERVATLVRQARMEFSNSLLFDAGDTIQGTALADYQAQVSLPPCDRKLGMYAAMDELKYDGATLGNHEFNYGLAFLSRVTGKQLNVDGVTAQPCQGPNFPIVLSNVFSARDKQPLYPPYTVLNTTLQVRLESGKSARVPFRVGLLGFVPPSIMKWDAQHLNGKVSVLGVLEAAQRYLPELRAKGVDLVVAISHGGIDTATYRSDMENANWHLAGLPGIDALLLGHSHALFPDAANEKSRYQNLPEVDNRLGRLRGKPTVMAGYWGKHLGVIKLALTFQQGQWRVDPTRTTSEVRGICSSRTECVAPDPAIAKIVATEHAATIQHVNTPIGSSAVRMSSYFAEVGDVSALSPVNAAQRDYTIRWIKKHRPELAHLPVLSAASPFKSGFAGPDDYTDVPAGPLSIRSAADLYFYPNTIAALKIDGKTLKAWLERSAERFNQIDPLSVSPQPLISKMPGYNFDVIQGGVSYEIDVTQPAGKRIAHLKLAGQPLDPELELIVVTNNYRASSAEGFPQFSPEQVVLSGELTNREVVADWIRAHPNLSATDLEPAPWRFTQVELRAPVTVLIRAGAAASEVARTLPHLRLSENHPDGSATYDVKLGL